MKKKYYLLFFGMLLMLSSPSFSQTSSFREGELSINPGISLGLIGYGYGYYGSVSFTVPVMVNVSYGITDMFSVGGYAGYMGRSYGLLGSETRLTVLSFGVQGAFHASAFLNENLDLDINEEKVDLYAKVILGLEPRFWTNEDGTTSPYYNNRVRARFGPVLGARYLFKPNLGVYAEGGRGTFGYLTIGLSFRI